MRSFMYCGLFPLWSFSIAVYSNRGLFTDTPLLHLPLTSQQIQLITKKKEKYVSATNDVLKILITYKYEKPAFIFFFSNFLVELLVTF